jgi:hypothetical protein
MIGMRRDMSINSTFLWLLVFQSLSSILRHVRGRRVHELQAGTRRETEGQVVDVIERNWAFPRRFLTVLGRHNPGAMDLSNFSQR